MQRFAIRLDPQWVRGVARTSPPPWGPLGYFVAKRTYCRRREHEGHTEQWHEVVERNVNGALAYGCRLTHDEAKTLFQYIYELKCSPGGRMLWQLGTPTMDRLGGDSACNCWYTDTRSYEDFCFAFDRSMLGGGVGFEADGSRLPVVRSGGAMWVVDGGDFSVPDTREGWVELLRRVYRSFFDTGVTFTFDTRLVRPAGAPILGFGGTASGPGPLIEGVEKLCALLTSRVGQRLSSVDVVDVHTIQGEIVKSGNVRRTALISLGRPDDVPYLHAKRWDLGHVPGYRGYINMTVVAEDASELTPDFWHGFDAEGEQFGLCNMRLIQSTDPTANGVNPCQPGFASVLTPDGIRKLRDISVGDTVWSGEHWTTVVDKWSTGTKPVYCYRTTTGEFVGTENHRVFQDGERVEAKDAERIDRCLAPAASNREQIDPQDIIDGWVVGDGMIHTANGGRVYLCVGAKDQDIFTSEVSHLVGGKYGGESSYVYHVTTTIESHEVPKTPSRFIPCRFFYGSPAKVRGFLRGLYSANGSVCGNRITLKATSFEVIRRVQQMLSFLGVASYYTTNESKEVLFENGPYQCRTSYDLNITTDRGRFLSLIGFVQQYKTDKVRITAAATRPTKVAYDVVSVEYLGDYEVFDMTVEAEEHSYWTGGVRVSNCAEANLASHEPCDLVELFASRLRSAEEFVMGQRLLYRVAKTVLQLPFLDPETRRIVEQNQRIGVGITGIRGASWTPADYRGFYRELRAEDRRYSRDIGANESAKLTVVKPSGTLSLLPGVQPGIHGDVSEFYLRRVRIASDHPLVGAARDHGYYVETALDHNQQPDERTQIVSFPVSGGVKAGGAIEQLEFQRTMQECWADQSVSATITFKQEEVPAIKAWLKANYRTGVKTTSFMRDMGHGFTQTPYEPISRDLHRMLSRGLRPMLDVHVERDDYSDADSAATECAGGSCPLK